MVSGLITKHLSVTIISVNGSEDLALLPDGLVFVSSVSVITFRLANYDESVNSRFQHSLWATPRA